MAGSLRAALVFAAFGVMTVAGQWTKMEKFSDNACTTLKDTEYSKLLNCMAYSTWFMTQTCVSGKITTTLYNDSACTTAAGVPPSTANVTCDPNNGQFEKESCVDSLPAGWSALELNYYTAANDCTGTSTVYTAAVKNRDLGNCKKRDDNTSSLSTMNAVMRREKVYNTSDCSGTPTSDKTINCDTCDPQGSMSSTKVTCAQMSAWAVTISTAGVASEATALAVSKVALVALAGMVAFLA